MTAQLRLARYDIKRISRIFYILPGDLRTNNLGDFLAVRYKCPSQPASSLAGCRLDCCGLVLEADGRPRLGRGRRGGSQVRFQPVHRDRLRATADVDHEHLLARPDDSIWPLVERLQRRLAGPHSDVHQLRFEELWRAVGVQLLPPQRPRG